MHAAAYVSTWRRTWLVELGRVMAWVNWFRPADWYQRESHRPKLWWVTSRVGGYRNVSVCVEVWRVALTVVYHGHWGGGWGR